MSDTAANKTGPLKTTPLTAAHEAAGAKMVEFGGYAMPVQYREGVLKEHLWTRAHAGAFDVSHMGPSYLTLADKTGGTTPEEGDADHAAIAAVLEPLVSADIAGLKRGQVRYALLLAPDGGVLDDLMIGRPFADEVQGMLQIVVNAGTKEADFAAIAAAAGDRAKLERADDNALVAIQGPEAAAVVATLLPEAAAMSFMTLRWLTWQGQGLAVTRSGYTGEDGYEILVPKALADDFWRALLADERVRAIGLGARDSLRLEAGLPLYGHDLDASVSPVEGNLAFAVSKRRRKACDFPGAARILAELEGGPRRLRVGLRVLEGAPAREGAQIADEEGAVVGVVTSGGFSPSLSAPIAMGFVPPALSAPGTPLKVIVRGKPQGAEVVSLPFVPHRYFRPN